MQDVAAFDNKRHLSSNTNTMSYVYMQQVRDLSHIRLPIAQYHIRLPKFFLCKENMTGRQWQMYRLTAYL